MINTISRQTPFVALGPTPRGLGFGASSTTPRPRHQNRLHTPLSAAPHQQRLTHLQAVSNQDEQHEGLDSKTSSRINEKGIEILDSRHRASFITEDGYPLDIYIDNDIANLDLSDKNNIYKLRFSLDHDDRNGHRTLQISDHFPQNESFYAKIMRDTIYGQWIEVDGEPVLDVSMHVNDNPEGKGPVWETGAKNNEMIPDPLAKELAIIGGEMRKKIFKDHVEDALQAMALGTRDIIAHHPELKQAQTQLRYLSEHASINEKVNTGILDNHLQKPILSKKATMAQFAANVQIWSDAMSSSTKAMRQLFEAILRPNTLAQLLKNPKTLVPTLVALIVLGVIAAHTTGAHDDNL